MNASVADPGAAESALTQDELASKAGVSRQTVLKIEGGLEPQPPTIRKLAAALGVEPAELMEPEP